SPCRRTRLPRRRRPRAWNWRLPCDACSGRERRARAQARRKAVGVDDEEAFAQRTPALSENAGVCERSQIAEEAEFAATEGRLQPFEADPAKRSGQRMDRQQEVRLAGDPALAVESAASTRDETVDVRVMGER